ncbi:MAG: hypothetical protein NW216_00715 [Hyphomicrobium sp.]|nr:hypothetical protein [Hyphomicrobium sp.]
MGGLEILVYVVFVGAAVLIPLMMLQEHARQFRGILGRPYGTVISELSEEGVRRGALMVRAAAVREARLERLERRMEQGR